MQGELILYIPARLSSFTCVSKDDVLCFNEVFIYIRSFFFQVRMLSSSLLRALLFLLVTSYVSAKKNKTTFSNQDVKNQTSEKRQNIGKWLLTALP